MVIPLNLTKSLQNTRVNQVALTNKEMLKSPVIIHLPQLMLHLPVVAVVDVVPLFVEANYHVELGVK